MKAVSAAETSECIEEALEICRVPAPTFEEEARAGLIFAKLAEIGLKPWLGQSGSVFCRIGAPGPALAVLAHLDTVFPRDTEIQPNREGSVIRAPGFADNSLGVAGLLLLARRVLGMKQKTPLLLVATTGEEGSGNLRGAREALEREKIGELIALEGVGIGELIRSGPGSVRWQIKARGPGGHSWSNRERESAVESLARLLVSVADLRNPDLAVNIGRIRGGTGISSIAAQAQAFLEIRSVDMPSLERAEKDIEEHLEEASKSSALDWEVERLGGRPGGTGGDSSLFQDLLECRERLGLAGQERAFSTDANPAIARGIPAVAIGLTDGGDLHSLDEWADVSRLGLGLQLLVELVEKRLG